MALQRATTPLDLLSRLPQLPPTARDEARCPPQEACPQGVAEDDPWSPNVSPAPTRAQRRALALRNNRFNRITFGTVFLGEQWATLQRVRVPDRLIAQFARNLATMYNAGVPLGRAIELMVEQPESLEWGLVIAAINRDLHDGKSLVGAFGNFPNIFSPTWMALMRRAMADGNLAETLHALAEMYERNEQLRARIRATCVYPCIVFATSLLIALTAFVFLLPQVIGFISTSGRPVPAITQILMFALNVMTHPVFLIELPVLIWINARAVGHFLASERGRLRFDHLKGRLPVVGPLFRKVAVARMMHSLKATLGSGVRLTLALDLAGAACGNAVYRLHTLRCVQALCDGQRLSTMFAAPGGLYDPMVFHAFRIGEETGQLDRMVESLAHYYDLEVSTALDNMLTMLEPLLIMGTGLLVAFVVLAIFLPLYAVVGSLA